MRSEEQIPDLSGAGQEWTIEKILAYVPGASLGRNVRSAVGLW